MLKLSNVPPCRILAWEVTRACNLACRHCRASAQGEPHPDELSTTEALAFLDDLAGLETPPMLIFTGGEPLLRADIYDLAAHAKDRGLSCVMAPNGTLLDARAAGKAIVALESTIISHGMPYPQNVEMAREVEQLIRDGGAVPATIAIIDGRICIGLSPEQLELLGTSPDAMKVSRRDLPFVLSQKKLGATTVAATMICAVSAGLLMVMRNSKSWLCVAPLTPLRVMRTPWPVSFSVSMLGTAKTRVSSLTK